MAVKNVSPTPPPKAYATNAPAATKSYATGPAKAAPAAPSGSGSGDYVPTLDNGSYGGGGYGSYSAPTAPAQTDDEWLTTDAAFQAQLAAMIRASQDYDADVTAQQGKYTVDYNDALKNLGWNQDDVATTDVNEGAWNFKDQNTAAGRSFQNQQNDFAGRGLLQSSLYGEANDNLTRSLNDQLGGVNTAKQGFFDDLARQQAAFKNENTLGQQQARAEALQRRAAAIF